MKGHMIGASQLNSHYGIDLAINECSKLEDLITYHPIILAFNVKIDTYEVIGSNIWWADIWQRLFSFLSLKRSSDHQRRRSDSKRSSFPVTEAKPITPLLQFYLVRY
ncbi:unnamed protein product [Citrullus colocynthis]|uniref:Uncharacterized protein n=1 Tax=Citrullus colocynthis TaxID=252529 RepID=A0ABP0Y433_9ROSI